VSSAQGSRNAGFGNPATFGGPFNELTMQNGIPLTDEMQLQLVERYGGIEARVDTVHAG
jgi:hypothetical protein